MDNAGTEAAELAAALALRTGRELGRESVERYALRQYLSAAYETALRSVEPGKPDSALWREHISVSILQDNRAAVRFVDRSGAVRQAQYVAESLDSLVGRMNEHLLRPLGGGRVFYQLAVDKVRALARAVQGSATKGAGRA